LICKDAGLKKTLHPLSNLNIDPAIRSDNVAKVVMDNDFIGDDVETVTHLLGVWHGSVEVEISEVNDQKLGSRGIDDRIDK
jgi:hypothetical protein